MSPPSRLAIATSSVQRLVKEEASYHKELEQQEARIKALENAKGGDENAEYELRQEKKALAETRAIFGPLRQRISDSIAKLEKELETETSNAGERVDEVAKAREVLTHIQMPK